MLISDDKHGLELLFKQYYQALYRSSYSILVRTDLAEDVVQDVFFKLWKLRFTLNSDIAIKPYLYKAVKNSAINALEKEKRRKTTNELPEHISVENTDDDSYEKEEVLKDKIDGAISQLPEKCRLVFTLSRYEGMSYQEIADYLDVSVKTVENQIGTALKKLRTTLVMYLKSGLIIILLIIG